jgi:hypothetical protein
MTMKGLLHTTHRAHVPQRLNTKLKNGMISRSLSHNRRSCLTDTTGSRMHPSHHPYHTMIQHQQKHIRYPVAHGDVCTYIYVPTPPNKQRLPGVSRCSSRQPGRLARASQPITHTAVPPVVQPPQITNKFKLHYH